MQDEFRRRLDVLELVSREGETVDHEHATDPVAGLPIGALLPEYPLTTIDGSKVSSRSVAANTGLPTLFLFVSPTCGPCQALLPDVIKWRNELSDRVAFAFVTSGSEKGNRKKFADVADSPILLDVERQFANAVGGKWTPTALFVDANGRIASHVAAADTAIEELVERIKSANLESSVLNFSNGSDSGRSKIGNAAPEFSLTDVKGREVTRDDLRGRATLVTFWSTTCPHCIGFLDEFKNWEHSRNSDDPNLIVFSDGNLDEHRALGFDSPVVLDKGYKIAAKLGMFGTPSAVLINEEGVISTETAVGADNIFALIGKRRNGSD
jgi:thiol-disulfide isomerase/thioredoxin